MVESWKTPFREGTVYYLDERDRVRGVLLWGQFGLVDVARELIVRGGTVQRSRLGAAPAP